MAKNLVIGIDASRAIRPKRTGTENYSWEVIRRLVAIDRGLQFRLYAPYHPTVEFASGPNVEWRTVPGRRLWSQVHLAKELRRDRPTLVFIPSHVLPVLTSVPAVVTIHDAAYRFFPAAYSPLQRRYLNFTTAFALKKAQAIIVPSESTKRDLMSEYRTKGQQITVVPLGYNQEVFNPTADHGQAPFEAPYVFYVGRIEERKNIIFLLEAFTLLAKEMKQVRLVLSGKNGYGFEAVQQRINSLPPDIRKRVLLPGYLPVYDMARYMRHAQAFAFPSQYEGFGLPVLEAMAIGTPVVSSNRSSLPEVAGPGTVTLAPDNPLSWAAALSRIIHQPKYADDLRAKGFKQAQKFSWDQTAEATLEVLLHACRKQR